MPISWLNHKPHAIAVYASWPALPSAHATLATGRPATALPGPVLHRLDCTSFCWRLRKVRLRECKARRRYPTRGGGRRSRAGAPATMVQGTTTGGRPNAYKLGEQEIA